MKFSEFFWSQNLAGIINCCGEKVEIGADKSAGEQIVIANANITTSLFSEINEVLIWLVWDATQLAGNAVFLWNAFFFRFLSALLLIHDLTTGHWPQCVKNTVPMTMWHCFWWHNGSFFLCCYFLEKNWNQVKSLHICMTCLS